ncbi:hypothetical protein [Nocardia arthritidis]|uniref:Uncharacterized protein n=1 Tax=Nocardia arthritidis TaxID=228602 RepID=A0A6G9YDN2_9NOCA|nr:hypothetical protein [Nocardia arthritidis]QIS11166.1 hypothetical protein F5544_16435 [Nocardia arthritidis]
MTTTLIGIGLFEMTLDDGRLPTRIDVNGSLHAQLESCNFSAAAMTGYYNALWKHDAAVIATGNFSALSVRPSRRAEMIALLNSKSLAEYELIERAAQGYCEFIGTGPTTDFELPSVTVTANMSRLLDIKIDVRWAASTQPSYIGYDIIECANQVRRQRPRFDEDGSWAQRDDEELEHELNEYRNYLTRNPQ